jgi:hypothetical protein
MLIENAVVAQLVEGQVFLGRTNIKQRKVSEVPIGSSNNINNNNNVHERCTGFRTPQKLIRKSLQTDYFSNS